MKKLLAFALCAALLLCLVACDSSLGESEPEKTPAATPAVSGASAQEQEPAQTFVPETWETHYQNALALWDEGRNDEAAAEFEASLELEATHSEVWLSFTNIMRGDPDGYINTLRAALENTGDAQTFQPLLDDALAAAADVEDGVISWIDPAVEQLVRGYLGKPDGDILRSELDFIENVAIFANAPLQVNTYSEGVDWDRTEDGKVYYLFGDDKAYDQPCAISILADFENFRNLDDLVINNSMITSIDGVQRIKKLRSFRLSYSPMNDASPAADAFWLETLGIQFCGLTDISGLGALKCIHRLELAGNEITDISPLSNLVTLEFLELLSNGIADIAPLSSLTRLVGLSLGRNPLDGLSALSSLTRLEELSVYADGISDVSPLAGLKNLKYLDLTENQLEDISPLSGLTALVELKLGSNRIADLSPLMPLRALERLTLYDNAFGDLTPLLALKSLQMLDVGGAQCSVALLKYIPELYY
ncbi:MAG TPA: leucine-rich repeat domain-containing protein [Clostridia bacterium]|nr:leucine-rich repeat domain-containing protein [Clostridia bacterium]